MIDKKVSNSAVQIRTLIDEAIKTGKITRTKYDTITHLATEDNHIDPQEKVLLANLHQLLEDEVIKIVMEKKEKTQYTFFYNMTTARVHFEVDTDIFTEEKAKASLAILNVDCPEDGDPIVEALRQYAMQAMKIATKDDLPTSKVAEELSTYPGFFNLNETSGITLVGVMGIKLFSEHVILRK